MSTDRELIRKGSAVYAQVLLEATLASGTTFEVAGQLEQVYAVIRGNIDLRAAIHDYHIPAETRIAIINEVFEGFDTSLLITLGVMVKRNELGLIGKVTVDFAEMAEEALDAVFIDVTTVVALDDALRDSIKAKYSAEFGRDVLIREHIDSAIMGGIVLNSHGVSIDASVASQLDRARKVLSQT
ncbi:MAG: ATP synthase F1 subunit delta [Coriobacteriia bacterium]|nr:ATP synthase F1 subunit delta [Coriobacteriia bacterium]